MVNIEDNIKVKSFFFLAANFLTRSTTPKINLNVTLNLPKVTFSRMTNLSLVDLDELLNLRVIPVCDAKLHLGNYYKESTVMMVVLHWLGDGKLKIQQLQTS